MAYLTAKTNGLEDLAAEILQTAGLTEADIDDVPKFGKTALKPPPIITATGNINWPSTSTGENFFDKALANGNLGGDETPYVNGVDAAGATDSSALDAWAKEEEDQEDEDADDGGWGLDGEGEDVDENDFDEIEAPIEDEDLGAGATPGVTETDHWLRNSPFAVDHVAAGSFESAMQVSNYVWVISIIF